MDQPPPGYVRDDGDGEVEVRKTSLPRRVHVHLGLCASRPVSEMIDIKDKMRLRQV